MKALKLSETKEPATSILEATQSQLGAIPNMFRVMANNPSLLKAYTTADESFRKDSGFTPQEQEVILLSVSVYNSCTYCVAAHSFLATHKSDMPKDILEALRTQKKLTDKKLNALSNFAISVTKERGYPTDEATDQMREVGYTDEHIAGVITAVGMKTMSNYINHIVETEVDAMFSNFKWEK